MLVIGLVEEDVFAVVALRGVLLQNAVAADAVLSAELLPEFVSDYAINGLRLIRDWAAYSGCRTGPLAK